MKECSRQETLAGILIQVRRDECVEGARLDARCEWGGFSNVVILEDFSRSATSTHECTPGDMSSFSSCKNLRRVYFSSGIKHNEHADAPMILWRAWSPVLIAPIIVEMTIPSHEGINSAQSYSRRAYWVRHIYPHPHPTSRRAGEKQYRKLVLTQFFSSISEPVTAKMLMATLLRTLSQPASRPSRSKLRTLKRMRNSCIPLPRPKQGTLRSAFLTGTLLIRIERG
jgi:hypothetical protein